MSAPGCHLTIGPVRFVLGGAAGAPLGYPGWPYRGFVTSPSESAAPGAPIEMRVRVVAEGRRCPPGEPRYRAGGNWAVWSDERGGWRFCAGFARNEPPRAVCRVSRDLSRATLYVAGDACDAPLRYPLDQVLSWGLLARCGGILLHAAAAVRDGVGVVFAGRSGAGKSTLSRLCEAEGWEVLNDDRVVVFPRADGWRVTGTPWPGSGRIARNRSAPLHSVRLLRQDATDALEPLPSRAARLALLPVASVAWFDGDWAQGALDAIERMTAEVRVDRFRFTRTPRALRALEAAA